MVLVVSPLITRITYGRESVGDTTVWDERAAKRLGDPTPRGVEYGRRTPSPALGRSSSLGADRGYRERIEADKDTALTALSCELSASNPHSVRLSYLGQERYQVQLLDQKLPANPLNEANNRSSDQLSRLRFGELVRENAEGLLDLMDLYLKDRKVSLSAQLHGGSAMMVGTYGDFAELAVLLERCPTVAQVTLVELEPVNFMRAARRFGTLPEDLRSRLTLECGDACETVTPSGGFQAIWAHNVVAMELHDHAQLERLMNSLVRKLAPHGVFLGAADLLPGTELDSFTPFMVNKDLPGQIVRIFGGQKGARI